MRPNLDSLKKEIRDYLDSNGLAVFSGFVNELHQQKLVLWDVIREPDFRPFIDCAIKAGVKLVVFNYRDFSRDMIEDALERIEETDLPREEQRAIERRLKELRPFDGFTCSLELVFEYQARCYIFDLRTEWYEELLDILDQIDIAIGDGDLLDEEEEGPMGGGGGYFSRN